MLISRNRVGVSNCCKYIIVSKDEKSILNPFRDAASFLWKNWGENAARQMISGFTDPEKYVERTYTWAFDTWKESIWQEFRLNGKEVGAPVFIVNTTQSPNYPGEVNEREFRSVWNQAWFSSLRSASGLYRYARRTNNSELLAYALKTKELALAFPQQKGFFPGLIGTEMERIEMMYCPENSKTKELWEKVWPFFNEKDYGFMMENYGHSGYTGLEGEGIGEFTIYDWGNGAASEAYNRIADHFGKEFILKTFD